MPELPEVETIVRMLAPHVDGKQIAKTDLRLARMLIGMDPKNFSQAITNQSIQQVIRRGKYIIFELTDCSLMIHLGMTGQLTFSPASFVENNQFLRTVTGLERPRGVHPVDKHTHLILFLKGGERILFRDPRTFGKVFLAPGKTWKEHVRLKILGPEPLDLPIKKFLKDIQPVASVRPIKAVLLDQSFLAGVGNIYSDEALFRSGIHPSVRACDLTNPQWVSLLEAVKVVLRKGIHNHGTSFSDYRKPDGTEGKNQDRLQVYGRGGEPCRKCHTILVKSVVAQRGTVHCPHCQGKPKLSRRSSTSSRVKS